jgi:murein DD-endopeptidase MepM/ murein hydrolase activator NlpD
LRVTSRSLTIVVSDPISGQERRVTLPTGITLAAVCGVLVLPILIGLGAAWKGRLDTADLRSSEQALQVENASYRAATEALAAQIESLQAAITDLGARSALDPTLAKAMDKLPALVKARAMGGTTNAGRAARQTLSAMTVPEDTFGLIRGLLESLESRLYLVRRDVEKRNALAEATPSIWPAHGWLSSTVGPRRDPVTGGMDFHSGLDIAGERGQPVYATASGSVTQRGYQGGYGNLIVIDHGFGLETRYGHLLRFAVDEGAQVKRGELIGYVGATGRATGYHLHYEVLANGRLLNPLQLLTQPSSRR